MAKTQYNLTNAREYFEEHLCAFVTTMKDSAWLVMSSFGLRFGGRGKLRGGRRGAHSETQPERNSPSSSRRRMLAALATNTNAARDERADLQRERAWSRGIRATYSP